MKNNFSIIKLCIIMIMMFGCSKSTDSQESDLVDGQTSKQVVTIQDPVTYSFKKLELKSTQIVDSEASMWQIYDKIDESLSNSTITTDLLGGTFGPIDGYQTENYSLGWNNRNRIMFMEILDNTVSTVDGLTLGIEKKEVFSVLGKPHIEDSNIVRYQNTDLEVFGILFQFDENDLVIRIIMYAYV